MLTYRMKKADRRGNTMLVLSPLELMMRLSSLIPAPGHPARKYFGILAGGAKDRAKVVPAPTVGKRRHCDNGKPRAQTASPVKWADLLKRVWGIQALECARCGATMTAVAVIENPEEITRYLAHTAQQSVHSQGAGTAGYG